MTGRLLPFQTLSIQAVNIIEASSACLGLSQKILVVSQIADVDLFPTLVYYHHDNLNFNVYSSLYLHWYLTGPALHQILFG